ncbi:MAG: L-glutamate gamma-semialdehyde dehydrogenase [Holophagaceae bacterium]
MSEPLKIQEPVNEPVKNYEPGSVERKTLQATLATISSEQVDMPLWINGKAIQTGRTGQAVMPHRHKHVVGHYHQAGETEVQSAINAALKVHHEWSSWPWEKRAQIFLKAADLLAGPWRDRINASTMLGQSKTVHQSEIDAACELIDFFRFNVHFYEKALQLQPLSTPEVHNRLDHRPLEGFIFAVSPFNFTSIAANLSCAPALCGNTVVWKPATTSTLSAHYLMQLLTEAGLPDGVINLVYGSGAQIGSQMLQQRNLAGIHFTGSTSVFQNMWKTVGDRIHQYRDYPRLVGETGGKDFILAHPSADPKVLVTALVRGSFEYQGQKCSASSRAYIPQSIWSQIETELIEQVESIKVGDVSDFTNFMGAVIDAPSFASHKKAIDEARHTAGTRILVGGVCDDREGYFVRPTIILTDNPKYSTMCEELFGPILTIYVYPDAKWSDMFSVVDQSTHYALTGAVFAQDRSALEEATKALRYSAGNFYLNDKPTGAMVGQQPFGGARASGTNDKGGSMLNLLRWISPRTIKETHRPPTDYRYPYMGQD